MITFSEKNQRQKIFARTSLSRIIRARFCGRHTNLFVIQCCVPTNNADDDDDGDDDDDDGGSGGGGFGGDDDDDYDVKNHFYNTLQAELWNIPKQDRLLVTGDMNAKVCTGSNNCEKRIEICYEVVG